MAETLSPPSDRPTCRAAERGGPGGLLTPGPVVKHGARAARLVSFCVCVCVIDVFVLIIDRRNTTVYIPCGTECIYLYFMYHI